MTDAKQIGPLPPARTTMVVTALAGFVIGSGILGLLWGLSSVEDGPAADARAACAALQRVGEIPGGGPGGSNYVRAASLPLGTIERLAAARSLAMAASASSEAYRELADHIDGIHSMVISLNFGDAGGRRHIVEAQRICGQV